MLDCSFSVAQTYSKGPIALFRPTFFTLFFLVCFAFMELCRTSDLQLWQRFVWPSFTAVGLNAEQK